MLLVGLASNVSVFLPGIVLNCFSLLSCGDRSRVVNGGVSSALHAQHKIHSCLLLFKNDTPQYDYK